MKLHVKAALHWSACLLRDFPLSSHEYIARKALEQLVLAGVKVVLGEVAESIEFAVKSFCVMRCLLAYFPAQN